MKNRSGSEGLTILELVAVLALIIILSSLLLSAITKAREMGRSSACVSNLKQLGQAIKLYILDEPYERFPGWVNADADDTTGWDQFKELMPLLYPYLSNESEITGKEKVLEVFQCSSNFNREALNLRQDEYGNRTDYEYNSWINNRKVNSVAANPEWLSMLYDWPAWEGIHRHGCNILFYDGHVKWFSWEEMLNSHTMQDAYYNWGTLD